jgi:hypothetical protein
MELEAPLLQSIATLEASTSHSTSSRDLTGAATTVTTKAVVALLACEESSLTDQIASSDGKAEEEALALESRAAQIHEVASVLALALHHESTPTHAICGMPHAASTLLVRITPGPICSRSYLTSFAGDEHMRRLDPHGWYSDAAGNLVEQAPQPLCMLLWPPSLSASATPCSPAPSGMWSSRLPSALRKLVLCLSNQLAVNSLAQLHSAGCHDAAGLLLSLLRFLLGESSRVGGFSRGLDSGDAAHILVLVAQAVLSVPPSKAPGLSTCLLGCLLILLDHSRSWAKDAFRNASPSKMDSLSARLVLELSSHAADPTHLALCMNVISHLLLLSTKHSGFMTIATAHEAAVRTMDAVLREAAHDAALEMSLPCLLRIVSAPSLAGQLLDTGLVRVCNFYTPTNATPLILSNV